MTSKKKPAVIILESNASIREHAASILSKAGWDVTCEQVSKEALHTLTQAEKSLIVLFISNFKLPKMEGDDILQKVKSISPLTQRMLMIPEDKPDILISAVNKANINSCITSPFKDEDFIFQARHCFKRFKHALRRQRLKRVIVHQNQQMFRIAQKLKKKDAVYKRLIDEKKSLKLKLKSKKRHAANKNDLNIDISLSTLMGHKEVELSPDAFKTEFFSIYKNIQRLFDQITEKNNTDTIQVDFKKITGTKESDTIKNDNKATESPFSDLRGKILKSAFIQTKNKEIQNLDNSPPNSGIDTVATDTRLETFFDISISESQTSATIKKAKEFDSSPPEVSLSDLLDLLKQHHISYGIIEDEIIETWISNSCADQLVIARGEEKILGQDGKIEFHFETAFTNPGKITEDGSIDFRDKGDIPFVSKKDLLAVKTLPREGRPGISVSGVPLPVDEAIDPVFAAGPGTELSEDGRCIHAVIDGQPHLDAMGNITVNPELVIPGDVDFETGNIDFKGNIIVKGMVKEGFKVKGVSLTAQEIEGADIELTGDLNVSAGITDAAISTHGNVYAKFINHSTIKAFGNLTISKEIIDSNVLLSGNCQNPAGHIISSRITAKMGIEASRIGTSSSKPARLKVGTNDHIETLKRQVMEILESSVSKSNLLKDEIKKLEDEDQELYRLISEKAQTQDRSQITIKELKKSLQKRKESNDTIKIQEISSEIKELTETAETAEKQLNHIFKTQDSIANKIKEIKNQIHLLEEKNKTHVIEKKALNAFLKKDRPVPVVTVAMTIIQDSKIKGPHASIILKEDASRCKIHEIMSSEEGSQFYEISISDL